MKITVVTQKKDGKRCCCCQETYMNMVSFSYEYSCELKDTTNKTYYRIEIKTTNIMEV